MAEDYEIGRGRPPKHSQFKKGQSGNPAGRPKGSQNLTTVMESALLAPTPMMVNGKKVRVTTAEAVIKKLVSDMIKGNMTAARILAGLMIDIAPKAPANVNDRGASESERDAVQPEDREIIDRALARLGPQRGGEHE